MKMPQRPWYLSLALMLCLSLLAGCAGTGGSRGGKGSDVVMTGLAQVGKPYVYGAEAPGEGFDCSGLTYYAHHRAGLSIPRTAAAQRKAAKPVRKNGLKAGDMVFFKTGPNAYHVGLMVDDGRFVHASTSRKQVMVSRLDNPYWQSHFLGAGTFVR
ncbi:C40 family peptidase [Thiocystis violacea]|uniref:C40 family peptidase n=1 Tax=Thiocystis violacea TaxID=13725 RepID=UPI00190347EA|nr:C40 family peptidase [Thiocystis violacea]MBK1723572.1 glycoside hydrolase [Thiocystis violacea]